QRIIPGKQRPSVSPFPMGAATFFKNERKADISTWQKSGHSYLALTGYARYLYARYFASIHDIKITQLS
ncbi:MAG TPA: hypothetical protein VFN66_00090, partial [Burkholderiales bacterium]|nr:hypothetical protein [Burkholderiales bacterium]